MIISYIILLKKKEEEVRGNIFLKEADYLKFLEILEHTSKIYNFKIHSLCLMTNHEYKRVGPLWQGRFKSWYVHDENYLGTLTQYIEQNPIKASITKDIGEYKWCASTLLFDKNYENLFEESILNDKIIFSSLTALLEEGEIAILQKHMNEKYKQSEEGLIKQKQQPLSKHFKKIKNLKDRNGKIILALKDGYTQGEVGRFLGVSSTLVSQINKSLK